MVIISLVFAVLPSASASLTLKEPIEDITIDEDVTVENALNLDDHFSNGEGQISFSYLSSDNKIDVRINEDKSVDISTPRDWFGAEEITFIATEGEQKVCDTIVVSIEPVNDAPELFSPLLDPAPFDEDTEVQAVFNLNDHFLDIDSILSYSHSAENIIVTVGDGGEVGFNAPLNWFGSEEVEFTASDGEMEISDIIMVTVNPVNDVPKSEVNLESISLDRDSRTNTVELSQLFSDVEDEALTFQVTGPSQINIEIVEETGQLKLEAPEDWNGKELLTVTASDSQGASQSVQFVVVTSKGSDHSSGPIFYLTGLVLAIGIAGVRLQVAGKKRIIRSPVKLESYRHFKGQ
jgi:hypothetical protein